MLLLYCFCTALLQLILGSPLLLKMDGRAVPLDVEVEQLKRVIAPAHLVLRRWVWQSG